MKRFNQFIVALAAVPLVYCNANAGEISDYIRKPFRLFEKGGVYAHFQFGVGIKVDTQNNKFEFIDTSGKTRSIKLSELSNYNIKEISLEDLQKECKPENFDFESYSEYSGILNKVNTRLGKAPKEEKGNLTYSHKNIYHTVNDYENKLQTAEELSGLEKDYWTNYYIHLIHEFKDLAILKSNHLKSTFDDILKYDYINLSKSPESATISTSTLDISATPTFGASPADTEGTKPIKSNTQIKVKSKALSTSNVPVDPDKIRIEELRSAFARRLKNYDGKDLLSVVRESFRLNENYWRFFFLAKPERGNLSALGLNNDHMIALALGYETPGAEVKHLNLSMNDIQTAGMEALSRALRNKEVEVLDLHFNPLREGVSHLAEVLPTLRNLKRLELRNTYMKEKEFSDLIEKLPETNIQHLDISRNNFKSDVLSKLADILKETSLKKLIVSVGEKTKDERTLQSKLKYNSGNRDGDTVDLTFLPPKTEL